MKKVCIIVLLATMVLSVGFAAGVQEQAKEFPAKDITLIVPFAPGGGTDALARKLAEIVTAQSGTNVIVENKTGGSGAVGMAEGAAAKADGYTVTMTTVEVVLLPAAKLANFQVSDFKGIIRVNFDAAALIVPKNHPANTLQEFVNHAKNNRVVLNVSAFPTNYWLCGAMLKDKAPDANIVLVEEPNGAAQQIANMLGGHVDAIICTMAEADQYVASGQFKFIAVASEERNETYPTVPTFVESGYDISVGTWRGFMVPKNTDSAVVAKLDEMFTSAYQSKDFQDFLKTMKFGAGYLNSADFAALCEQQAVQYGPVIAQYL